VNAHVIRHLDTTGRTAGHAGRASLSEWDAERRVRPSVSNDETTRAIGLGGTFARCAQRAERMPTRRSLLDSLRAVLTPGRTAGGVIGS
jgi:hypothetical protein